MSNFYEDRKAIIDELETLPANVYWYPPEVVIAPAVIIVPDDPYIEPFVYGRNSYRLSFNVTIAVSSEDNQTALNLIEELAIGIYEAALSGWAVGNTSAPRTINLGQSELLASELQLTISSGGY
jgi:hypothetical protein